MDGLSAGFVVQLRSVKPAGSADRMSAVPAGQDRASRKFRPCVMTAAAVPQQLVLPSRSLAPLSPLRTARPPSDAGYVPPSCRVYPGATRCAERSPGPVTCGPTARNAPFMPTRLRSPGTGAVAGLQPQRGRFSANWTGDAGPPPPWRRWSDEAAGGQEVQPGADGLEAAPRAA
jgi:hypothetical protein